jgi:hypothetical protein
VLYDAAPPGEKRPFPKRLLFTGWFHTGRQGKEWPGSFEIVEKKKPHSGRVARSVNDPASGNPWIRLHLRGERPVGLSTHLRFRYHLTGAGGMRIGLFTGATRAAPPTTLVGLTQDAWAETTVDFGGSGLHPDDRVDEIRFLLPRGAELLVDDILLFEPEREAVPKK